MTERPTLILLPAMPCDADFYSAQVTALSDLVDPRIMILDSPDLEESARQLLANAPERFLLAGTAYGGRLAMEVATMAPECVSGLWLMNCDPGPHPEPKTALETVSSLRNLGSETILAEWAPIIVDPAHEEARERFIAMVRRAPYERFANQYEAAARRKDRWNDLTQIDVPTLLIWGAEDQFVPVAIGQQMAQTLPSARFVSIDRCRHFPTMEKPERCNTEARIWIDKVFTGR